MTMENAQQPAPKTVVLPPTRAAQTWDRATDALVAAAEEAKAKADYDAAKFAYQAARQHAHVIRQLRQLARVGDAPPTSTPTPSHLALNGRWSRAYEACIGCNRTDSKHASRGYCDRCVKAGRNQEAQTHE